MSLIRMLKEPHSQTGGREGKREWRGGLREGGIDSNRVTGRGKEEKGLSERENDGG